MITWYFVVYCVELLIDSSGISVYATGGGHSKENAGTRHHKHYEQVRKLHILLDLKTGATPDYISGERLVGECELYVKSIRADEAYDRESFRKICHQKGATQIIPPQLNARIRNPKKEDPPNLWKERNESVAIMMQSPTRKNELKQWKKDVCYGQRAKVGGHFHRFKKAFGFSLMSSSEVGRWNELVYKNIILNSYNQFPKPIFQIRT